jgi:hypothetical protein
LATQLLDIAAIDHCRRNFGSETLAASDFRNVFSDGWPVPPRPCRSYNTQSVASLAI